LPLSVLDCENTAWGSLGLGDASRSQAEWKAIWVKLRDGATGGQRKLSAMEKCQHRLSSNKASGQTGNSLTKSIWHRKKAGISKMHFSF
jgi:hypothetical protein